MKRSSLLWVGGLIVAAINGKYFGAYNDPPTGSIALYLLTIVLLGGWFVVHLRAWLNNRST